MTRPILDLRKETVKTTGSWVAKRWREKDDLYLAGAMTVAAEAEGEGGRGEIYMER